MSQETGQEAVAKCPASAGLTTVVRMRDLQKVMRSPVVHQNPDVSTGNYLVSDPLGDINAQEFMANILAMTNGDEHRRRRRLLNSLVRPDELVRFREDVILPSVDRWMSRSVTRHGDGTYGCDLAAVVELIFLEFAAKIIGLEGVETEESMARLRGCILPMFGGMSASHFEDREGVTKAGVEAKRVFVEEYYTPSLESMKQKLARVESGELDAGEVPLNLLRMIATGADPAYLDEDVAIREAILFFVATTGTSSQAVMSTVHDLSEWFIKHPEDKPLVEDLEFVSRALQESLRLKAPYVAYVTRLATEDVDVPGCPVKAGDEVHAMIPQAGRDRDIYGSDADEFNPHREVPEGVNTYGLAFGAGPHQCLGLRAVLGNDGKSGSHLRLVQGLFAAGVRPDPNREPVLLAMNEAEDEVDIPTYMSYPVLLDRWKVT